MTLESRVVMLEKKINLIAKVLEIQSMEGVQVSEKARKEIKVRMGDFLKGRKSGWFHEQGNDRKAVFAHQA